MCDRVRVCVCVRVCACACAHARACVRVVWGRAVEAMVPFTEQRVAGRGAGLTWGVRRSALCWAGDWLWPGGAR